MGEKVVLIVEDSPTVKYEVRMLLEQKGIKVFEAGGEIGLFNQIEQYGRMVDLIIMDLTLKNENGLDLTQKVKDNPEYATIPILILTEHADAKNVLKAREMGVAGYVLKPIKREEFLEKVMSSMNSNDLL